ncbi:MAG: holo-[acyl-carrier-protein] synthase [Chloroflexi bacterium]|nr:holo-[acyl-carrier-protein] synthase [Chloroflexota bacterium]
MSPALSTGVDMIEISRIGRAVARWGERFLAHVYTPAEVRYCRGRVPELAARFAAKEAISKALGTGLVGISCTEMEVLGDRWGKPQVTLYGRALARAQRLGLSEWAISLSHCHEYAVALVVASAGGCPQEPPARATLGEGESCQSSATG